MTAGAGVGWPDAGFSDPSLQNSRGSGPKGHWPPVYQSLLLGCHTVTTLHHQHGWASGARRGGAHCHARHRQGVEEGARQWPGMHRCRTAPCKPTPDIWSLSTRPGLAWVLLGDTAEQAPTRGLFPLCEISVAPETRFGSWFLQAWWLSPHTHPPHRQGP